jgi:hypothetical protein
LPQQYPLKREHSATNNCLGEMKTKLFTTVLCVLALLLSTVTPAFASGDTDATAVAVDVIVARPVSFAMTILGSVLFVVSLPVAAPSHGVGKVAHALVVTPAKDTFTRPLGNLEGFLDY